MRAIPGDVLRRMYVASNWEGFKQTAIHLAFLVAGGWLVLATRGTWWVVPALFVQGIFVNALFGAMHESVHYGSFRSRRAADVLAFFAGAAILNNAGFYRHYHTAHHRYTQDPARDPELITVQPPKTWSAYLLRLTSIPFLILRLRDLLHHHLLLSLQLLGIEHRVLQDVGQHVDGERHVFLEHARHVGGLLPRGVGVEMSAHVLDLFRDATG